MLTDQITKDLLDRANLTDAGVRRDAEAALAAMLMTAVRAEFNGRVRWPGKMTEAEYREAIRAALRPANKRQRRIDAERLAWTCDGRWVPRGNRRCDHCGGFHGLFGRTEKARKRTWIG